MYVFFTVQLQLSGGSSGHGDEDLETPDQGLTGMHPTRNLHILHMYIGDDYVVVLHGLPDACSYLPVIKNFKQISR